MLKSFCVLMSLCVSVAVAGCGGGNSTPSQPTVSLGAPSAVSPTDNAVFKNGEQPVTLVVQNVSAAQGAATTYAFEIATDAAFTARVLVREGVTEGSGGQTTTKLDTLFADKDYFWHARAQSGSTIGAFGSTRQFHIGPAVSLSTPIPLSPLPGTQISGRPTFTVSNAARFGPVTTVVYRFEIATNSGFSPVAITAIVPEGAGRTSFTPTTELATNASYFWRATAIDEANAVSSATTNAVNFTALPPTRQSDLATQLGIALWPGVQPPGTTGHAVMGDNWQVQTLFHRPTGTTFISPTAEELRIFDLMDRGMSPDAAIDWMKANGYATIAAYYPAIQVIGVLYEYLALVNGHWDIVLRLE